MDTKLITIAVISLIVGAGGGYAFADINGVPNQQIVLNSSSMHGQMSDMMTGLDGKTGDDFDKAFISEMIVHHEGAVDMAEAALKQAQHEEIRQMAAEIISAQTQEIQQMKDWQKSWYGQ